LSAKRRGVTAPKHEAQFRSVRSEPIRVAPQYFFRADPKGVIDRLSTRVMKNQIDIAPNMMVLVDRLSVEPLNGRAPISDADLFG
jgi:hypothetical protein